MYQLFNFSLQVYAVVSVVASYSMVFAPSISVESHGVSSWRVGLWDQLRLVHLFEDSLWVHLQGGKVL